MISMYLRVRLGASTYAPATASLEKSTAKRRRALLCSLKVDEINFSEVNNKTHKVLFENLTPLFPDERLQLERGNGSTEDLTTI